MIKIIKVTDRFDPDKGMADLDMEAEEIKQKIFAKHKLIEKFQETMAVIESIDHGACREKKTKKSMTDIFQAMDDICLKLDITPQSEKIALQTTGSIMKKLNGHFENYLIENDISEEQGKVLKDFFYDQLNHINPRLKKQDDAQSQS